MSLFFEILVCVYVVLYACRPGEAKGQSQLSFLGVIYSFVFIFDFGVCNRLAFWPGTCQELHDEWMAIWSTPGIILSLFPQSLACRHHQPSIFLFYNFGNETQVLKVQVELPPQLQICHL